MPLACTIPSPHRGPRLTTGCLTLLLTVAWATIGWAQQWPDEHTSGPFFYHADFQLRPFYHLLQSVSELRHEVPRTLELGEVEEPVHVFLFQRKATYQGYLQTFFPKVPTRPALFIKQRGPGMVFAHLGPAVAIDLRHETTHAVLHSILPMVPLWLDEGLGEYFELEKHQRATGHPHFKAIKTQVRWGRVPRLEHLERLGDIQEMKSRHYRDAWAWTHFLLHGPAAATKVLREFLADIKGQVPPGQFSQRLRHQIPRLDQAYLEHFQNWPPR